MKSLRDLLRWYNGPSPKVSLTPGAWKEQKPVSSLAQIENVAIAFGVIAFLSAILFVTDIHFKIGLLINIPLSFVCGIIGKGRKIGFGKAFFASVIFTPFIGFPITLGSPKIMKEYRIQNLSPQQAPVPATKERSVEALTELLDKLNQLRKDGALTDEEFRAQKEKLLNAKAQ